MSEQLVVTNWPRFMALFPDRKVLRLTPIPKVEAQKLVQSHEVLGLVTDETSHALLENVLGGSVPLASPAQIPCNCKTLLAELVIGPPSSILSPDGTARATMLSFFYLIEATEESSPFSFGDGDNDEEA